jgi:hypothetical protein
MVRMTYTSGGSCEELIITSAYFPYDSDEPLPTRELMLQQGKHLIDGCDANAHHILRVWQSTGTNYRGGSFME